MVDEDRAEEDLGQFIDMLAEPRPYNDRMVRVKLLFIFDEMDKMEAREGQDVLIRSLKNLFLRRHAVFLLVFAFYVAYFVPAGPVLVPAANPC